MLILRLSTTAHLQCHRSTRQGRWPCDEAAPMACISRLINPHAHTYLSYIYSVYIYMCVCARACVCFTDFTATPTVDIQSQSTTCTYMKLHETWEYIYILKNCEDPILERALSLQLAITTHEISEVKRFLKGYQLSHVVPMGCPTAPENSWKIHGMWMKYEGNWQIGRIS